MYRVGDGTKKKEPDDDFETQTCVLTQPDHPNPSLQTQPSHPITLLPTQASTEYFKLGLALLTFMLSGPMLIMSNKMVLSQLNFKYPLTLTAITLLFTAVSTYSYVKVSGRKCNHASTMTLRFYMVNIFPIGALSAATIGLGMTSYMYLTVSFVQMLKALTPVMTMMCLVMFRLEYPTTKAIWCVITISLGTAVAGYGELELSLIGALFMISAQAAEALKLVFTQVMLSTLKFDVVETMYYNTPAACVCVLMCACFLEFPSMTWGDWRVIVDNSPVFVCSCVFAVITQAINTVVIRYSSALVLKISITARNALFVIFNAVVLGEAVTVLQVCGYTLSLVGFAAYNYVQSNRF